MTEPIDTLNMFAVTSSGDQIVIGRLSQRITREEALNLAAWLVVLADRRGNFADRDSEFRDLLERVQDA